MTHTDLAGLIEKLEAAEGGSRELDAEAAFEFHAVPCGVHTDGKPRGYLWPEDNPSWNLGLRFPGKTKEWAFKCRHKDAETLVIERDGAIVLMNSLRVRDYTTSLDAALALVEERLGADVIYHMGRIPPSVIEQGDTGHGYYFDLPEAEHVSSPNDIHATGHTLALAACVALCRALQSDTVTEG